MFKLLREKKARLSEQVALAQQENSGIFRSRSTRRNVELEDPRPPGHEVLHTIPENAGSSRTPNGVDGWSNPNAMNRSFNRNRLSRPRGHQIMNRSGINEEPRAYGINESITQNHTAVNSERRMFEREQNASVDTVCQLRELIRERYALDIQLWNKRDIHKANRRMMIPKCEKADNILQQIYWIVNAWEEEYFDEEEWAMVQKIRACLWAKRLDNGESNEPAVWTSLLPWDRRDASHPGRESFDY